MRASEIAGSLIAATPEVPIVQSAAEAATHKAEQSEVALIRMLPPRLKPDVSACAHRQYVCMSCGVAYCCYKPIALAGNGDPVVQLIKA
jgi:hypothetical protein